jgi:hypothetical protein
MKNKLFLFLAAIIFIFLAGCSAPGKAPAPPETAQTDRVRAGGYYGLYEGPRPETMLPPPGRLAGGLTVEIAGTDGQWLLVRQGANRGWIPQWYISDEPGPVKDLRSENMVLNRNAPGLLYPDGPQTVSLRKGNLLLPVKEWKDWVQADLMVYSIPGVMTAWTRKEYLSPIDAVAPIEGYLRKGSPAYVGCEFEEMGQYPPEEAANNMSVLIREERNGYLRVEAAGGWDAWVKKDDIGYSRLDRP